MILHHIKPQILKALHLLWEVALCPWFFWFLISFHAGIVFCFDTGSFFSFFKSMCYGILLAMCRDWERASRIILQAVCSIVRNQNPWRSCTFSRPCSRLCSSFLLMPPHHPRAPISSSPSSFEESIIRFAFNSKSWRASSASCDYLGVFRLFFQDFFTPPPFHGNLAGCGCGRLKAGQT